ncbi:MAG: STAS domain-containing protein [Flavobacteriales bacterium]|jgi:anti-sigma B factor antagonist|nr:STAS domain-containing protein [Flavobacteriales bacterium]MBK6754895.1 STAS domain-containing protein [Flavobacteriales bacterium]MBK7084001.1 STAS domain-containing protein [Flavobacteriales bacterium]MBK7270302.1 STAS domain-containing protein [Flavobacteriales bacterium]MBK7753149.1 STAS domain-containing protein [Flavobacteriales bacterium]
MTERPTFDLEVETTPAGPVFKLHGRLMDQQQADKLMSALEEGLSQGRKNVVLDMSQLQYMNSTGLNILINVLTRTRNAGGDAIISGLSPSVRQLFVVTKLDSVFTITSGVDEALAKLQA